MPNLITVSAKKSQACVIFSLNNMTQKTEAPRIRAL